MSYENRLYQILYPHNALIASQLTPEQLAEHYLVGSSKYYDTKIIFCEVDSSYRNDYFDIDGAFEKMVPHDDGRPKATKFISSYRVLEHVDMSAIKNLYLTTASGRVLELSQAPYEVEHEDNFVRTFAHVCPVKMLVMTKQNAREHGEFVGANKTKGAPKVFYTQIELDVDQFIESLEKDPYMSSPFAFVHPCKLRDTILELKDESNDKVRKGLSLKSDFAHISYKNIRHGWWISSEEQTIFFPMPGIKEIEKINFPFLKDM